VPPALAADSGPPSYRTSLPLPTLLGLHAVIADADAVALGSPGAFFALFAVAAEHDGAGVRLPLALTASCGTVELQPVVGAAAVCVAAFVAARRWHALAVLAPPPASRASSAGSDVAGVPSASAMIASAATAVAATLCTGTPGDVVECDGVGEFASLLAICGCRGGGCCAHARLVAHAATLRMRPLLRRLVRSVRLSNS